MSEENVALAQCTWELTSQHDPYAFEEVSAATLVWHEPDQDFQGVEEAEQYNSTHPSAPPDLSFTVENVISEGDKVVTHWTVRGIKRIAVNVLAALALCGLALTLVLLFAPDFSWSAVIKWLMTSSPCPSEYLR
jgi:hypothetical protein